MSKINMLGDNLLLTKVEVKTSEFDGVGAANSAGSLFTVAFAGPDAPAKRGETVFLKPGVYDQQVIEGEVYTFAEGQYVAGKVKQ